MKKFLGILLLAAMLMTAMLAGAESATSTPAEATIEAAVEPAAEFPMYGCIYGTKVNVRKFPQEMYPSRGQLVNRAPIVILSEKDDCYYCDTYFGEGYIPKKYVTIFDGMTQEEFREYRNEHASVYRKGTPKHDNNNAWLLEQYYEGKISKYELLTNWYCEPTTGYTGLYEDDDGKLHVFRRWWW